MLASDDKAELFYRCHVASMNEMDVTLQYIDLKAGTAHT
jgi:hypothetical protein